MATYNGHKNWNHWNVSLWINNDQALYSMAQDCLFYATKDRSGTREEAAQNMMHELVVKGIRKTPDGAPYSTTTIRAAMVGM